MGALDGLKVLELGQVVAAPFCGVLLADFGATVIKVENPGGDSIRTMGPIKDGRSLWYLVENRNKKSIKIDLKTDDGKKILEKLIVTCDVMTENFRPGVLEKLGFSWEYISKINPRIILARMSGYGQTGPYSNRYGYDRVGVGMGGLTYITGFKDMPPLKPGVSVSDYLVGFSAAVGILSAIYERDILGSGKGQMIDVGLYEPVFRITEFTALNYSLNGYVRERTGNAFVATVPSGHFKSKDGKWISLAVGNDKVFKRLVKCIHREDLLENPKYSTHEQRMLNREYLDNMIEEWIAKRTSTECFETLANDVPMGPIHSIKEIFADPHYAARENIIEVEDKLWGKVKMQGVVPKLSRTPGKVNFMGPDLGADTNEILINLLGYTNEAVENLRENNII